MGKKKRILRLAAVFSLLILIAGCTPWSFQHVSQNERQPFFPPQTVMQSGDYKTFFSENAAVLKSCSHTDECAGALFNLCFLYCYPKSPYYDPAKARKFISDLIVGAPQSPWAAQAKVWRALIDREMEAQNRSRRLARKTLQSRTAQSQNQTSMQKNWEVDRQILEDQIKSKDEIIKELTRQIQGSRKIDLEMEKKEKGLLH